MIDYEQLAKEAANNHSKFESFAWSDEPEDSHLWTVVYTNNRDADLLAESNADAIDAEMDQFVQCGDVVREHHGHWACGWVSGYSIRVYDDAGDTTDAFRKWCDLYAALEEYPILDEEDYSRREYEATIENIKNEGSSLVNFDAKGSNDWAEKVFGWLYEYNQRSVENSDGQGGYPSEEDISEALKDLGLHIDDVPCHHDDIKVYNGGINMGKLYCQQCDLDLPEPEPMPVSNPNQLSLFP